LIKSEPIDKDITIAIEGNQQKCWNSRYVFSPPGSNLSDERVQSLMCANEVMLQIFFSVPNPSSRTMAPGFSHPEQKRIPEDFWK
jgi:hypothetical protein